MRDDTDDFVFSIQAAGLTPPQWPLQADGEIHRYSTNGRASDDAGWYVLHSVYLPHGARLYGAAGDWRSGTVVFWNSGDTAASAAEAAAFRAGVERQRRELAAQRRERAARGRKRAEEAWEQASRESRFHGYLASKFLERDDSVRVLGGDLLVPMRDWDGTLWNVQYIGPDGSKRYGTGRAGGLFHWMGADEPSSIILAEGYATGRSALQAGLADAVVVAFSAGQLVPVAKEIRRRFPRTLRWVLADNDAGTPGNPGLRCAAEAAAALGGNVLVPDDGRLGSVDFNDLWVAHGRGAHSYLREVTP